MSPADDTSTPTMDEGDPPPVLDEQDYEALAERQDGEARAITAAQQPRQSNKRGKRGHHPDRSADREIIEEELNQIAAQHQPGSKEIGHLDLDEYLAAYDWSRPQMKCRLERLAPGHWQGVRAAGVCEDRVGIPYTYAEIGARFGGGEYKVTVLGPRSLADSRVVMLGSKKFSIPGTPNLTPDTLPAEARELYGQSGSYGPGAPSPARFGAPPSMMRPSGGMVGGGELQLMHQSFKESADAVTRAHAEKATVASEAAERRAIEAEVRLQTESAQRQKLEEELRKMEREAMDRNEMLRDKIDEIARKAGGDSMAMISTLLPQFSGSAQKQVEIVTAQFEAREERIAAQHTMQLNQTQTMHQMQLDQQRQSFELQLRNTESMHQSNVTLLKGQIQILQSEKEALLRQVDDLRQRLDRAQNDLMTHITTAKQPNTLDQVQQFVALKEAMEDLTGKGGGEDDITEGLEGHPLARSALKFLDRHAGTVAETISNIRGAPGPQMQMMPQQMYPMPMQQMQMHQQQMLQAQQQGAARGAIVEPAMRPQAPAPAPKPQSPKLKREDLESALAFIDSVLAQPTPPAPAEFARTAVSMVDNTVLRELARRAPDKVLAQLEDGGLLKGHCATDDGKAYITEVLKALKQVMK